MNRPKAIAYSNGTVHMFLLGIIKVIASFETGNYPFDLQTVTVLMITMTHIKEQIDVSLRAGGIEIEEDFFRENIELDIGDVRAWLQEVEYSLGTWQFLNFEINIARRGKTLVTGLILPEMMVSAQAVLYILLPAGKNERVPFVSQVLLQSIIFLTILNEYIPIQRESTAIQVGFFMVSFQLVLITFIVAFQECNYKRLAQKKQKSLREAPAPSPTQFFRHDSSNMELLSIENNDVPVIRGLQHV